MIFATGSFARISFRATNVTIGGAGWLVSALSNRYAAVVIDLSGTPEEPVAVVQCSKETAIEIGDAVSAGTILDMSLFAPAAVVETVAAATAEDFLAAPAARSALVNIAVASLVFACVWYVVARIQ